MKPELNMEQQPTLEQLMNRLIEAEETIEAIKFNKIDALLISTKNGEQVWTLKDSERPYRAIVEQMKEGAITISTDGTILFSNIKFAELLDVPFEHIIGSSLFKWIAISDLNSLSDFLHQNQENSKFELNLLKSDGKLLPVSILLTKLTIDDVESIICLTVTDLTYERKNEELIAAEKLARSVIEQASDAIIVCDEDKKIIRASKGAERLAGDKLLNKNFDEIFTFEDENNRRVLLQNILKEQLPVNEEVLFRKKNNEIFNLIFKIAALSGTENKLLGYIITLTNITSHVQAEEKISASLQEKTILLKEIHHRIKNNLQMVSSLLNIQASYIKDDDVKEIFRECQQRIRSMALIHKKLYEVKSFSSITIDDYIEDMVGILCNTYLFNSNQVIFNFSANKVSISLDAAVPLGLILNELITNSFKHAFSGKPDERLFISIVELDNEQVSISIKDNGRGIPEDFRIKGTETLGLQLVHTLVDQLDGKIELFRDGGTEFRIVIPL